MQTACPCAQTAPVVVQLLSRARLFVTPWIVGYQAPLSSTISQSLLKFVSIELVMPQPPHPLSCQISVADF